MIEMHDPTAADWNERRKEAREVAARYGHNLGRFSPIFYPGGHTSAFAATEAHCARCGRSFVIRAYWRLRRGNFLPYFRTFGWAPWKECACRTRSDRLPVERAA